MKRSGAAARREAFADVTEALSRYLATIGWTQVVIGKEPSIVTSGLGQECVLYFTGEKAEKRKETESHD